MTSASSSSPKKGLSFFSYHRNLFGRRLWVGVVSIVLQLLFYTVATPLRIVYDRSQVADQLTTEIARATYRTKQAQMIFGQMCLSSIAMGLTLLLAVVIAHQGFAYVFSRRELDFYMSQPVKRSRHFRDVSWGSVLRKECTPCQRLSSARFSMECSACSSSSSRCILLPLSQCLRQEGKSMPSW